MTVKGWHLLVVKFHCVTQQALHFVVEKPKLRREDCEEETTQIRSVTSEVPIGTLEVAEY